MKTKSIIGSAVVGSAGIGAGLMYLLDRSAGKRRRAMIRDKAVHGVHVTRDASGKISRDLRNRAQGMAVGVKRAFSREEQVDDSVLTERVRASLGNVITHPGSIRVEAAGSQVRLTGDIPAAELDNLLRQVRSVRGVREVVHDLKVQEQLDTVSGLQGETERPTGARFELRQVNWSPSARILTGFFGAVLISYGVSSRKLIGALAASAGLPLLVRAATNMPLGRIVGVSGRRGIDIQKSITINAPPEEVFNTLRRVEDFPSFMTHVRGISKLDQDRYRWTVSGPAGIRVNWDSVFTAIVPNRRLAWRSEAGSRVQHAGVAEVAANPDGSTAVHIRLTYNPLIGSIGHVLLKLFGADPKTLLDADLVRLKTFMETGKQPHDAAATTRHG